MTAQVAHQWPLPLEQVQYGLVTRHSTLTRLVLSARMHPVLATQSSLTDVAFRRTMRYTTTQAVTRPASRTHRPLRSLLLTSTLTATLAVQCGTAPQTCHPRHCQVALRFLGHKWTLDTVARGLT